MKWITHSDAFHKIVRKFLWWPVTVHLGEGIKETRWWEKATVEYQFMGCEMGRWYPIRFLEE